MVKDVEELRPELQPEPFGEWNLLEQREVPSMEAWAYSRPRTEAQNPCIGIGDAACRRCELQWAGLLEGSGIPIPIQTLVRSGENVSQSEFLTLSSNPDVVAAIIPDVSSNSGAWTGESDRLAAL